MSPDILTRDIIGKVVILVIPPETYGDISQKILTDLVKGWGMEGIYVSMNKPYSSMKESLENLAVLDKIIFVDGASSLAGESPVGSKLVLVDNPANLSELSHAIGESAKKLGARGFLVFDSLSTLLIYNSEETSTRFAHTLTVRMKLRGLTSLLLAVKQEVGREMVKIISPVADKLIYLNVGEEVK